MPHTVAPIPAGILGFVSSAATWSLQLRSRKCQNSPRKPHDSHTSASISFICPQCWVRSKATLMTAFPINSSSQKVLFVPKGSIQNESTRGKSHPGAPLKHHSTGRIWEMQFHQSFIYQQIPQIVSLRLPQAGSRACAVCKKVGQHWGNARLGLVQGKSCQRGTHHTGDLRKMDFGCF